MIDKLYRTYSSELGCKRFVYDGGKTLYTVGPLPLNKYEFKVLLEKSFTKRYFLCMTVLFMSCFIFPLKLIVPTLAVVPTARVMVLTEAFMRKLKEPHYIFPLHYLFFLDVSTTVIIKPGPVIEPRYIDWEKVTNLYIWFMNLH